MGNSAKISHSRANRLPDRDKLLSQCDIFGLTLEQARHRLETMLQVVQGWRQFYSDRGVARDDLEYLEQAIVPVSFFRDSPPDPV